MLLVRFFMATRIPLVNEARTTWIGIFYVFTSKVVSYFSTKDLKTFLEWKEHIIVTTRELCEKFKKCVPHIPGKLLRIWYQSKIPWSKSARKSELFWSMCTYDCSLFHNLQLAIHDEDDCTVFWLEIKLRTFVKYLSAFFLQSLGSSLQQPNTAININ